MSSGALAAPLPTRHSLLVRKVHQNAAADQGGKNETTEKVLHGDSPLKPQETLEES
jgi:hypothetical protein